MGLNGRRPEFIVPQEGLPPQQAGGFIIWLTGLSGAGKTTLANALRERLAGCGRLEVLDGDEMRTTLCRGLGFSREDRDANVFRIGYVAKLLARNGVIAICAAVSPFRSTRAEVRRNVTNFIEVFVDCPVEVAESRDTDGLYARARMGDVEEFTGVNAPYEAPEAPEVHLFSARESVDDSVWKVLQTLEAMGIIGDGPAPGSGGMAKEEEIQRRLASLGYL